MIDTFEVVQIEPGVWPFPFEPLWQQFHMVLFVQFILQTEIWIFCWIFDTSGSATVKCDS